MRHKTHTTAIVAMMLAAAALLALPPGADGEAAGPAPAYAVDVGGWLDASAAAETMHEPRLHGSHVAWAVHGTGELSRADDGLDPVEEWARMHGAEQTNTAAPRSRYRGLTHGGLDAADTGIRSGKSGKRNTTDDGTGKGRPPERGTGGADVHPTSASSTSGDIAQSRPRGRLGIEAPRGRRADMSFDASRDDGPETGTAGRADRVIERLTC